MVSGPPNPAAEFPLLLDGCVVEQLIVGRRGVVAVGRGRGVGAHHGVGGAWLCWIRRSCRGNARLAHPAIDTEALQGPRLLQHWSGQRDGLGSYA